MKKCIYCGAEFKPINPKGKFCSDKCRVYWNRKKGGLRVINEVPMYIPVPEPIKKPEVPYIPQPKFKNDIERMAWEFEQQLKNKNK